MTQMLKVIWQFNGNTYVSAKVHQELFGHKTTITTKSGEKIPHYYDGLLGEYNKKGEWLRKNGVERVSNCCHLISKEYIDKVKEILDKHDIRYWIDTDLSNCSRRGDWRRK